MTLLQPAMLWSLAIVVPLAAIYFLKVRPRRKPTTAYFLWDRIFQERRASSLFQRLRDAWSLILMLLATMAVCFALAKPEWTDERKDLILVIDTSASMGTEDGSASRLERAKDAAEEIVTGLNGTQRAAIASLDGRLTYRSHLTDNPRDLLDAVESLQVSSEALGLTSLPTPTSAGASAAGSRDHRVVLISDGAFDQNLLPAHVELIKVGTYQENVGLVAADMAFLPGSNNRAGLYFQVASTFAEPLDVDLTLTTAGEDGSEQLFKVIPLSVKPGANPPETFHLEDVPAGRWTLKLDVADALERDNIAYLAVARPRPIRVGIESADPYFLEKSVEAFSHSEGLLELVASQPEDGSPQPEITLAKSTSPRSDSAVVFQPEGESVWWSELGVEVEAGAPRVLVEGHPALRFLDPASVPFVGAKRLSPPAGAQVLVADDSGLPLIYKARHEGRTALVVNIDPVAADFYFSAWFPVLVHSATTHLAGRENLMAAAYRPLQPVPIPGGREDVETTLTALKVSPDAHADGTAQVIDTVRGDFYVEANRLGFYRMVNASGTTEFGVNISDKGETLVNNERSKSRHDPLSRGLSPAHWLTLLAIVVLAAESVLYHRRKVG